ncbi:segregation/condensation protein A [Flavihumibacter sp. R14]|nr:segregation/condensation protein A [Flavihumibacter soli]
MIEPEGFAIKLPQFEGPFDLLLFFIERDELDIHDVPIARITDDFLNYLEHLSALNIELASEFIFVAATLMRIKSRMLLPRPELDEAGNEIDLKEELLAKLIEYKRFKQVSEELRRFEEERLKQEIRGNIASDMKLVDEQSEPGDELVSFDLYKLLVVYERVMKRYEERTAAPVHTVIQYPYTIELQKKLIADLIRINKTLDFEELLKLSENKVHFVYNFLAMLEMLQQQLISIETGLGFNDFSVESKS